MVIWIVFLRMGFKIGDVFVKNIELFCMEEVNNFYSLAFGKFVRCMDYNTYNFLLIIRT